MRRPFVRKKKEDGSKYHSKKVEYNGMMFDSQNELNRYLYLLSLQKEGKISCLRRQTPFVLIPKTTRVEARQLKTKVKYVTKITEFPASYHNDFTYIENGIYVSEEYKSKMTSKLADYILRRKLMVRKIYDHNKKGRSKWIFREVVFHNKKKTVITDK